MSYSSGSLIGGYKYFCPDKTPGRVNMDKSQTQRIESGDPSGGAGVKVELFKEGNFYSIRVGGVDVATLYQSKRDADYLTLDIHPDVNEFHGEVITTVWTENTAPEKDFVLSGGKTHKFYRFSEVESE